MKKRIKITTILSFATGLLIGMAVYLYNKPKDDLAKENADHSIEATKLALAYSDDEAAANKQFLGKVLEVKGEVSSIEKKESEVIVLKGNERSTVRAELAPTAKAGAISEGQLLTIRGKCSGFLMDVVLNECVIVK